MWPREVTVALWAMTEVQHVPAERWWYTASPFHPNHSIPRRVGPCLHQDVPQQHSPPAIPATTRANRHFWFCRHTSVSGSGEQEAAASPAPPACLPCASLLRCSLFHTWTPSAGSPLPCTHGCISWFLSRSCTLRALLHSHTLALRHPPQPPQAWKAISCSHSAVFCRMCACILQAPMQLPSDARSGNGLAHKYHQRYLHAANCSPLPLTALKSTPVS